MSSEKETLLTQDEVAAYLGKTPEELRAAPFYAALFPNGCQTVRPAEFMAFLAVMENMERLRKRLAETEST